LGAPGLDFETWESTNLCGHGTSQGAGSVSLIKVPGV